MSFVLLFLILSLLPFMPLIFADDVQPSKLLNIDYIGLGYDAVLGNPHNDLYDPGFTESVIALTYVNQTTSADGKWLVPDNIQALQTFSCSYDSDTVQVSGMSSYQDSLLVDASTEGGAFGFEFSASVGYQQLQSGTDVNRNVFVSSIAKCIQYEARVRSVAHLQLSNAFMDCVADLPETFDAAQYFNFISKFGTHYSSAVILGAKAVIRSEFSETMWTRLSLMNISISAGARASFSGFTGGGSVGTEMDQQAQQSFENSRTTYTAAFIGSQPSKDGNWQTWAKSSGSNPYPVEYSLRPLTELLVPANFPNMNSASILAKQQSLSNAYTQYCFSIQGCGIPPPDRIPLKMYSTNCSFINSQQVSCRVGYSLLSCALSNVDAALTDNYRYAIPIDETTCSCYGSMAGSLCIAWCSNIVLGFEIITEVIDQSVLQARCSADKMVIGCSIQPSATFQWPQFYPQTDGKGCICYDGTTTSLCLATCASNVTNYEIRTQYGVGVLQVLCSPGNYALGCGIKLLKILGPTTNRYAFVDSLDSCMCYDEYGATCYAICGHLN